ncbi:MAG: hypothetical protein F6K65_38095, partial [Moorea sp. SIO3C2]|nr:hypothetical protein [Moorena sp. SIO3C2]
LTNNSSDNGYQLDELPNGNFFVVDLADLNGAADSNTGTTVFNQVANFENIADLNNCP